MKAKISLFIFNASLIVSFFWQMDVKAVILGQDPSVVHQVLLTRDGDYSAVEDWGSNDVEFTDDRDDASKFKLRKFLGGDRTIDEKAWSLSWIDGNQSLTCGGSNLFAEFTGFVYANGEEKNRKKLYFIPSNVSLPSQGNDTEIEQIIEQNAVTTIDTDKGYKIVLEEPRAKSGERFHFFIVSGEDLEYSRKSRDCSIFRLVLVYREER